MFLLCIIFDFNYYKQYNKVIVNADVGSYVVLLFYSHFCTPRRHQRSSESLREKIMYNIVIVNKSEVFSPGFSQVC